MWCMKPMDNGLKMPNILKTLQRSRFWENSIKYHKCKVLSMVLTIFLEFSAYFREKMIVGAAPRGRPCLAMSGECLPFLKFDTNPQRAGHGLPLQEQQ